MNKAKYIILLLFPFIAACVSEEKEIFDGSSVTRMNAALQKYKNILVDAPNGWLFEYYPEENKYGGFNLYMKFSADGEVVITAESSVLQENKEEKTSLYLLKSDMGPVLTFDTYNRIFHQFSDPKPDGVGYEGDYEFIITNADEKQLELKGKKNGMKMTMTQLPENKNWEEYRSEVDTIAKYHPGFTMEMHVNNKQLSLIESSELGRYLTFESANGDISTSVSGTAFIYTPTGMKFKSSVTIDGHEVQNFIETEEGILVSSENENIIIKHLPLNQAFAQQKCIWYMDQNRMGRRFTSLFNSIAKNLDEQMEEELLKLALRSPSQLFYLFTYNRPEQASYYSYFYMQFIPAEKDNELTILYEGGGDQVAMLIYYDYFRTFLSYISDEAPFELSYNNLKIPNEITFVRTDDPEEVWFVTTK